MTNKQAIKVIEKSLTPTLQKLAFGANLYDSGIRTHFAVRSFKERQKIRQAMKILTSVQMSFL